MKHLKKSILFWTVVLTVVFLGASALLDAFGLKFRIWIREPVTILIALYAALGILQLLLHIPKKKLKITAIVLWTAAFIAAGIYGYILFAFMHLTEQRETWEGRDCIVETEHVLWVRHYRYYEYHNWFVCGNEVIHQTDG